MKVLIIGADGMIGHKIAQTLHENGFEIFLNSRSRSDILKKLYPSCKIFKFDFLKQKIHNLLDQINPDYIINTVGITIRRGSENLDKAIILNSELTKKIDVWCNLNNKRQIHFSSDCIFSGEKGNYDDYDISDAADNYGKTKANGEVNSNFTLTIRSSMIGREIFNKTELLEWVISNKNLKIKGFDKVIYSGVTTLWMSKILVKILREFNKLKGIYNISSEPISKHDLLKKINHYFDLNIDITSDISVSYNKSLNSNKFFYETDFEKPDWDKMLEELREDSLKFNDLYNLYDI